MGGSTLATATSAFTMLRYDGSMGRLVCLAMCLAMHGYARGAIYFYNGDLDGAEYLPAQVGGNIENARVYENFVMFGAGQTIDGVFGSFSMNFVPTHALVEIRLGTTQGQAGQSFYSSVRPVTVSPLSGSSSTGPHFRVRAAIDFALFPGHFHFTIAPMGVHPTDVSRIGTTSGSNAVGFPTMDGSAFYLNPSTGHNYAPASSMVSNPNFSLGIDYTPFPEPATFAVLGIGALWIAKRRRR